MHVILSTLTIFMLLRDGVEQSHHSVTMAQHMQLPLSDDYLWSGPALTVTVMHPFIFTAALAKCKSIILVSCLSVQCAGEQDYMQQECKQKDLPDSHTYIATPV